MIRSVLFALFVGAAVGFQPGRAQCFHSPSSSSRNALKTSHSLAIKNSQKYPKNGPLLFSSISKGGAGSEQSKIITLAKPVAAASMLAVFDILFRRLFQELAISFPSSLAGCGTLFATFLLVPGGDSLYQMLSPGAALLAKWLPVFFVPSLITLPLADSVGSISEVTYHLDRTKFLIKIQSSLIYPHFL